MSNKSTTPTLRVNKAGPMSQIQDLGRFGVLHLGFSQSGAMDEVAFRFNNALLGNPQNAAQIEIALGGAEFEVLTSTVIAITGSFMTVTINNTPIANWGSHHVNQGDTIRFLGSEGGVYTYFGVSGGFDVKAVLGSRSTTTRLHIGGLAGRLLAKSDVLISQINPLSKPQIGIPRTWQPDYKHTVISVIAGYQQAEFSEASKQNFYKQAYKIKQCNRMGVFLSGQLALSYKGQELTSEGTMNGSVQILPSGQPVVLMKDAQSIGGYPKVGVVSRYAQCILAQQPAGKEIYFLAVSPQLARQHWQQVMVKVSRIYRQVYGVAVSD